MIKVKNVTKKYGKFYAVRNVDFEVKDGEIVGFLGRNGAGKTTTMNMITGYIEPTEGEIIVNGYNIDVKPKKAKAQIGYMPEGTPLYSDLTVKEFVKYMAELKLVPRKERKEAVKNAIESTGLEKVQNNLTRNLSRGYKQRVSLAGAIVGNPDILILDEPTVGLDPKQVVEIRELIKSFRKNHTVLISSHILSEVSQLCEKVIIIDKGEIIAVDTPENLEKQTTETTIINVTVDDLDNKFEEIKNEVSEITEIKLVKDNQEDKTKDYLVKTSSKEDIRKKIFSACAKNDITIIGMKLEENSLEEAFMKLVEDRPEYSQKEINKMQYEKEIEELREEERINKEEKANRKQAIKEEKARKKAAKEAKKEAKKREKEEKNQAEEPEKLEENNEEEKEQPVEDNAEVTETPVAENEIKESEDSVEENKTEINEEDKVEKNKELNEESKIEETEKIDEGKEEIEVENNEEENEGNKIEEAEKIGEDKEEDKEDKIEENELKEDEEKETEEDKAEESDVEETIETKDKTDEDSEIKEDTNKKGGDK